MNFKKEMSKTGLNFNAWKYYDKVAIMVKKLSIRFDL